jgi:hypothetical protein
MKKISGRDWFYIAAVVALIAGLSTGSGKEKGKPVPLNDRHRSIYDAIKSGRTREATEIICTTCHSKSSLPLPAKHPPKEQCLICHALKT